LELQIKILQNASRDADKLELLLKVKEREKQEAMHIEDTPRLVMEIEMLRVILHLVMLRVILHLVMSRSEERHNIFPSSSYAVSYLMSKLSFVQIPEEGGSLSDYLQNGVLRFLTRN
jgi:hypothetical protein